MSARAQTVRLTPTRHRALAGFAKSYGLSEYAMLARVVDIRAPERGLLRGVEALARLLAGMRGQRRSRPAPIARPAHLVCARRAGGFTARR